VIFPHVFLQPGRDVEDDSFDANVVVTMDTVMIKIVHNCVSFVFCFIVFILFVSKGKRVSFIYICDL
jgi:hypothetical protein